MSNAELLIEEIKTLPVNRMAEVLDFVEFIKRKEAENAAECPICAAKGYMPNAETIAAIEEGRAILRGEIPSPEFNSIEEFFAELRS